MMIEIVNNWGVYNIWIVNTCLMTNSLFELGLNEGWECRGKEKRKALMDTMCKAHGQLTD